MKLRRIIVLGMLVTLMLMSAVNGLEITETAQSVTLDQGETKTVDVTVTNDGASPITISATHDLDLVDNGGDKVLLTFSDPGQIDPGTSATVTLTFEAEDDVDFETYNGVVTITGSDSTSDTFTLDVIVEPNICKLGVAGGDLDITIEDPNNDDDFKPGDMMDLRINVKNNGDDDIKAQVHAFLFSEKTEVVDQAAPTSNIEDGEDEDFKFTIEIPLDARRIDEDESYFLLVKAIDDDNEGANCATDRVDIKIELENKDVMIDQGNTYLFPSTAVCGDTVSANVQVVNIGARDNDRVQVSLQNDELGIKLSSFVFSLGAFSSEEGNTKPVQFDVPLSEDVELKDYIFRVTVNHDGGTESSTLVLPVTTCESLSGLAERGVPIASIDVVEQQLYAEQGQLITIPIKIKNEFGTRTTYFIALTSIEELGESSLKSVTLGPGQETTVFLELALHNEAPEGTHSAVIEVSAGSVLVRSDTVTLTVTPAAKEPFTMTRFVRAIPTPVWIVIDVLVLILLLSMAILVGRRIREMRSSS